MLTLTIAISTTTLHIRPRRSVTRKATFSLNRIAEKLGRLPRSAARKFPILHSPAQFAFADCAKFPGAKRANRWPAPGAAEAALTREYVQAGLALEQKRDQYA